MTDLEKFEELFKSVGVEYTKDSFRNNPYITIEEKYNSAETDFDFNADGSFRGLDEL